MELYSSYVGRENMELDENERKMIEHIQNSYAGRTITCPEAQRMAGEWNVRTDRMAALLSEAGIKIVECMLGCFGNH